MDSVDVEILDEGQKIMDVVLNHVTTYKSQKDAKGGKAMTYLY